MLDSLLNGESTGDGSLDQFVLDQVKHRECKQTVLACLIKELEDRTKEFQFSVDYVNGEMTIALFHLSCKVVLSPREVGVVDIIVDGTPSEISAKIKNAGGAWRLYDPISDEIFRYGDAGDFIVQQLSMKLPEEYIP